MSLRTARLNEQLKREVAQILLEEENFGKGILVTVTRAEVSPDLSGVKIFVSVLPEEHRAGALNSFKKRIYHIQQIVNKHLLIKKVPKIVFLEETKTKEAGRIEELLSEIRKNRNQGQKS